MYLLFFLDKGNGPKPSIATISNGPWTFGGCLGPSRGTLFYCAVDAGATVMAYIRKHSPSVITKLKLFIRFKSTKMSSSDIIMGSN